VGKEDLGQGCRVCFLEMLKGAKKIHFTSKAQHSADGADVSVENGPADFSVYLAQPIADYGVGKRWSRGKRCRLEIKHSFFRGNGARDARHYIKETRATLGEIGRTVI